MAVIFLEQSGYVRIDVEVGNFIINIVVDSLIFRNSFRRWCDPTASPSWASPILRERGGHAQSRPLEKRG